MLRVPRLRVPALGPAGLTMLRGLRARLPFTVVETDRPEDPQVSARRSEAASRGLARLTVVPVLAAAAWLLPGLPLLAAGVFAPVPMVLIAAPLMAAIGVNVLHRIPAAWPTGLPVPGRNRAWSGWLAIAGTAAVVIGFTAWQIVLNSPSVLATRTPGVSFQAGYWIAQHGSLPIPGSLRAFGGGHFGLRLSSIGFAQHGQSVVPLVTPGLPMLLAAGFWTSGTGGGALVAPLLGGLAVLSFAGLVGRLAGRNWAPAGALVLALTLPEMYTSRDAFSEPAVQILLFGGLSLLIDALTTARNRVPAETPAVDVAGPVVDRPVVDRPVVDLRKPGPEAAGRLEPAGQAQTQTAFLPLPDETRLDQVTADQAASDLTAPLPPVGGSAQAGLPADGDPARHERPADGSFLAAVDTRSRLVQDRAAGLARRPAAWVREFRWRDVPARAATLFSQEVMLAGLGGLCLGLTSLLSLTSLTFLIPVIIVAAVLLIVRRLAGRAFSLGLVIGVGYGAGAGFWLARAPGGTASVPLRTLGISAAGLLVLTIAIAALLRVTTIRRLMHNATRRAPLRWLPVVAGLAVVAALGLLAARPYLQTVHGTVTQGGARYVAALQRLGGLRVDPTRLYSEDTLYWVIWYAGVATVLLGGFGAAIMVRRCLQALLSRRDADGAALNWAAPLTVILGGSAAVLWQPFTVPDQPWASRRLVPVVLPGLILLAIWAAAWLRRRAKARGAGAVTSAIVGVFCVGAMVLPSVSTAFGLGLTHSGSTGGLQPTAGGLAQHRVGADESAAVRSLCASIGRSSTVLIVDPRVAAVFSQVVRGMCGVPVARLAPGTGSSQVAAVVSAIARAGRHPVLLGSSSAQVGAFGGTPSIVLNLSTTQYPHVLTQPPGAPWRARYRIWMATVRSASAGV